MVGMLRKILLAGNLLWLPFGWALVRHYQKAVAA